MKLGLKLWSKNTDFYFEEAKKLFQEGWFDYIELYVVPETLSSLEKWKILKNDFDIPFTLHAPHFIHGVNLANPLNETLNLEVFKEVAQFIEELEAEYVVVHSGIEGDIDETIRQLKIIKPKKMLIENKPFVAPLRDNRICRGAIIEEISKVIDDTGCGFCLDIGHAICTANSLQLEPYGFLEKFNELKPTCYHLSDNFVDRELDKHLHFGQGNYDLRRIFDIINLDKNIAIEANKNSKENLDDFIEDVKCLKIFK